MAEWDYEIFWKEMMNQTLEEIGEQEFSRWFNMVEYLRATENQIVVAVPSAFYRDQVKVRYQNSIETKLKIIIGKDISLDFEVVSQIQKGTAAPRPAVGNVKKEIKPEVKKEPVKHPPPVWNKEKRGRHPQLREDYIFEKYVIGDNNLFAANAAMAISRNPGTVYNPFLIYGNVGLGKTHLMQAIGNYIHENSDSKVIYITAENFTNEFIQAIREDRMPAFKNKYRFVDILLMDDIHFLENKWETQEELFHTFNALYDANKHIIFTCDRPASELKKISERLRSRFERGLNVDLQPPNYETRCAILKAKIKDKGVFIADEVINLIAKNVSTNIRDLEAALTKLIAYGELLGKPITVESAQQQLKDVFSSPNKQSNMSLEIIQRVVAEYFSITLNDLKNKKRSQNVVQPRQVAMYLSREITEFSTTEIGQAFGGRHYSTVMHACQNTEERIRSDPTLDSTIQTLIKMIQDHSAAT